MTIPYQPGLTYGLTPDHQPCVGARADMDTFETVVHPTQGDDKRFQLLLDTLPHVAFLIAPGGLAEYYNQRLVDYIGFEPGRDKDAETALHHPADRARLMDARTAGAGSSREYIVEARMRRHDGVYRWHRIHNKPLIRDGNVAGWIGTAVDIHDMRHANEDLEQCVHERTAELQAANQQLEAEIEQRRWIEEGLRESEARYRMLYNRTPMALHSVDAKARLLDVNDTWTAMFGYTREQVIGRSPAEFMTPASAELYFAQAWPEMLTSRGQVRTVDYQFVTKSGTIFDGRLAARGDFDADGRFVRSWAAIADVTLEKRKDRELRQAQRMEAVGQLTAGIAHDFNNLLTAVLGNLEMLSKGPELNPARAARLLAGARSAAERGAKLTTQLLAFSRQQQIAAVPMDLNSVIRGMMPLLVSTIGGAIGIKIVPAADLWVALGDPTQLELAVLNLVINARDAMQKAGTIALTTRNARREQSNRPEEPPPGDYIEIEVRDNGSGMTDAVQDRIFEPFFTTKDIGKGSGLGLSQVLGVIKQLGGGLAVKSTPGEGTAISIFLPRAGTAVSTGIEAKQSGLTDSSQKQQARILVVDDDPDVRMISTDILRDAGYEVTEAASGAAALELLRRPEAVPDLLVVDVAMPGMDGGTFAAAAMALLPSVRVLFVTGYADARLMPANAGHEILPKPYGSGELEARVGRIINQLRRQ